MLNLENNKEFKRYEDLLKERLGTPTTEEQTPFLPLQTVRLSTETISK